MPAEQLFILGVVFPAMDIRLKSNLAKSSDVHSVERQPAPYQGHDDQSRDVGLEKKMDPVQANLHLTCCSNPEEVKTLMSSEPNALT